MKKRHLLKTLLLLFALIAGSTSVCAQEVTTLYLETFGSSASNTPLASYTGYSATASMFTTSGAVNSHYSGSGSVGKNNLSAANLSNGYTNASGLSGCYHVGTANTEATIIQISNIKIDGYKDLFISFGALGSSTSHKVNVSYKIDDGEETSLISNGSLTNSGWTLLSGNISGTGESLTLYFKHTPTKAWTVRLDDIKVTGLPEGSSTTPSISADDVDIAFNATGGSISYTINSGVDGGTVSAAIKEGNWITLGQGTTSPISFTCTANEATTARTATVTLTYTYNSTETVTKDVTVTQAAAPEAYSTIPALFDAATTTETNVNVTFGGWVVSGVNSSTAYVTDNEGNGFIIYKSSHGFNVNDKLSGTVTGTPLKLYKGAAEFTNLTASTTGLTVTNDGEITVITNKSIADLGGVNTGAVFTLSNLTYDGTNLSDGTNTIQPYNTLYAGTFEANKTYNVTGVYLQYDSKKEILPRSAADIVEVVSTEPSISVSTNSVEATAAETDGTITVTYNNITNVLAEVQFYEADGTTSATYDWLDADINSSDATKLDYAISANTGSARTAYMKVYAIGNEGEATSELITITQAAYVAPFESATYTLASSITSGKHYIIVGEKDVTQAMGAQNDNNRAAVDVTISDGVATVESADVFEFVIYGPDADGYYTIFDAKNDGYLYAASSTKNYLKTEAEINDNARWKIEFGEEGVASIKAEKSGNRNVMQYNPSYTLFSCYESAKQNSVYLYEKDDEAAPTESVTVSSVSYATYSSENALNFSNTGITVYTAEANGTSVSLTPVSDGIVPAYTGVVLYANGGASATVPVATSVGSTNWTNNEMVANVKRAKVYLTEGDKTNYILSNEDAGVGFYKAAANGAYLPANRAYLSTTATATGNAPFLGFDGNETTGINSVERGALSVEGCYTLDGRRVAQPTKGLYIVNGRKVIIK